MQTRKDIFNQQLRDRTFGLSVSIYHALRDASTTPLSKPIVNQIIRSSSSVASNYRAATRSRSDPEFYAKICIVVEEIDETQFWLDYLVHIEVLDFESIGRISAEVDELVRIFTSIKSTMKVKLRK